jgi:hypothetical protein
MKFISAKILKYPIFFLLTLVVAVSITGKVLLSLPVFYNQTPHQRALTFGIISLSCAILVYLTSKIFILPNLHQVLKWRNLVFLVTLFLILSLFLGIDSANYWSIPEIHNIEICFEAHQGAENIRIPKLIEPNTNYLYPASSFGQNKYSVFVNSGECVNGRLVHLTSLLTRALILPGLTIYVEPNPPDGRFFVSVNDAPSVVVFNQEEDQQLSNEVLITEGLDQGSPMPGPWKQTWFMGLKVVAVFISAAFLSLFLFGLTEKIITEPKTDSDRSNRK